MTPVFHGMVSASGELHISDQEAFRRYCHSLVGQSVDIIVRKPIRGRSLAQNDWFHAVPVALLSEYWGENVEATKLLILGEKFGWHDTKDGHRFPMKPSSSALTVEEFSQLVDWLPAWAAQEFGVIIPLPSEVDI